MILSAIISLLLWLASLMVGIQGECNVDEVCTIVKSHGWEVVCHSEEAAFVFRNGDYPEIGDDIQWLNLLFCLTEKQLANIRQHYSSANFRILTPDLCSQIEHVSVAPFT